MTLIKIDSATPDYGQCILDAIDKLQPSLVCFDYFDTLVHREVAPEDVKRIACERIAKLAPPGVGTKALGQRLYALRQQIEADICNQNASRGLDQEFSLPDAWGAIWEAQDWLQRMSRDRFVETATGIELAIECQVQYVDGQMRQVLATLADRNIPMALVSDFYLPGIHYKSMLECHGLDGFFNSLHVSCDYHLTKRSGRLFTIVSADKQIPLNKMLMIGDNPYSDAETPVSMGMAAIHLDRTQLYQQYQQLSTNAMDYQAIEHQIISEVSGADSPFGELILTLYIFIERLYYTLYHAGIKDVFFMAREGQFLKTLFDHYQASRAPAGTDIVGINSHYFRVSRRATFLPSLRDLGHENFHTLFRQYRCISINEFMSSIGLEDISHQIQAELPLEDFASRLDDLPTSRSFNALLSSPTFRAAYESARSERQQAFQAYLESFGVDPHDNQIHLVDVGWKGTIQDNIRGILDQLPAPWHGCTVVGHYLGLVAPGNMNEQNTKHGLVFSSINQTSPGFHIYNENRALFEVALGADHGSAHTYAFDKNHLPHVIDGDFEERPLFEEKIRPLQKRLLESFTKINRILSRNHLPRTDFDMLAARAHARMVLSPSSAEIRWFEDAYHVENFGVFEASKFVSSRPRPGIFGAIRFYWTLRTNPQFVDLGFWPWLRCYQQGGRLVAWRYAQSRLKTLRDLN